jgi:hypothetical protein
MCGRDSLACSTLTRRTGNLLPSAIQENAWLQARIVVSIQVCGHLFWLCGVRSRIEQCWILIHESIINITWYAAAYASLSERARLEPRRRVSRDVICVCPTVPQGCPRPPVLIQMQLLCRMPFSSHLSWINSTHSLSMHRLASSPLGKKSEGYIICKLERLGTRGG